MTEATLMRSRMRVERNFVQIPNAWMRDNRLSFRARGLLAMLMSHEGGSFKVTLKSLAADNPESIDTLRNAVNELEELGYLKRYRKARGNGNPDTWDLCDPHESGLQPLETVSVIPMRKQNRVGYSNANASDIPTPIRTLEEDSLVPEVTTERCPSRTQGAHLWTGDRCAYCAVHRDDIGVSA